MGLEDYFGAGAVGGASDPPAPGSDLDLALQLLELNEMRADGTISEEEFAGWVAELLPTG